MEQSIEEKIYAKSLSNYYINSDSDDNYESFNSPINTYKKNFIKEIGAKQYLNTEFNPIKLKFQSDPFSVEEQNEYDSYINKSRNIMKELDDKIEILHEQREQREQKPCPPDKIRNPETGRCIKKKEIKIKEKVKEKVKETEPCPPGKIRNSKTGRCIKEKLEKIETIETIEKMPIKSKISLQNIEMKSFNKNSFSVMLAQNYTQDIDPKGYYLSEKLDGIRAVYHNGEFISRTNKPFYAPKWFTDHYPMDIVFDGELFTKRKDFKGVMSTVTKKIPIDSEWEKVVYMVFDLPTVKLPFEERYELLKNIVDEINISGNMRINYVNQHKIKDRSELEEMHKTLTEKGAEGTMLRKPKSSYENIRSSSLLKYKDFIDDEAVVEGFEFGNGRNSDRMGNLIVKWLHPGEKDSDGNVKTKDTFNVGSGFDDNQRLNYKTLFPKGTVIKIKYGELQSSGKPRFPTYLATIPKKFAH